MAQPIIRLAAEGDLAAINEIYNHFVLHSTSTYQEELETMDSRRKWFEGHGERHPVTVAVLEGQVVGWGALSPYHRRSAFRFTVENSVYLKPDVQRRGIGSEILSDLIERATAIGHHSIIAAIDGEQVASIALHAKFGFEHVGVLKEAGMKFGRWLDVVYTQKKIGASRGMTND